LAPELLQACGLPSITDWTDHEFQLPLPSGALGELAGQSAFVVEIDASNGLSTFSHMRQCLLSRVAVFSGSLGTSGILGKASYNH
jgi:hypothetical protein